SSISSATVPRCWPKPLPKARRSPSLVVATPWRPSTSTGSASAFPISPPAAVLSWSSSRARYCRLSRCSSSAQAERRDKRNGEGTPEVHCCLCSVCTRNGDLPCVMLPLLFVALAWPVVRAARPIRPAKCSTRRRCRARRHRTTSGWKCKAPVIPRQAPPRMLRIADGTQAGQGVEDERPVLVGGGGVARWLRPLAVRPGRPLRSLEMPEPTEHCLALRGCRAPERGPEDRQQRAGSSPAEGTRHPRCFL